MARQVGSQEQAGVRHVYWLTLAPMDGGAAQRHLHFNPDLFGVSLRCPLVDIGFYRTGADSIDPDVVAAQF